MSQPAAPLDPTQATMQAFGVNVRRARVAVHLSLDAVAAATGLTPAFIIAVEEGYADPSLRDAVLLATAIGRDLLTLFPTAPP